MESAFKCYRRRLFSIKTIRRTLADRTNRDGNGTVESGNQALVGGARNGVPHKSQINMLAQLLTGLHAVPMNYKLILAPLAKFAKNLFNEFSFLSSSRCTGALAGLLGCVRILFINFCALI